MDLRQLRHFVTVARTASISAAALHLGMTQPALSKSLRTLEQSLGVRLFDRGPTGVSLTPFGEKLRGYGQIMLSLSAEAVDEIEAMRGGSSGSLRIGAVASALRQIVPQVVAGLEPGIAVSVAEGLNDTLPDAVRAGRLDLAIIARPETDADAELEFRPLLTEPIVFVTGSTHPLAGVDRVTPADLAPYGWLAPPRPEPDRLKLDDLFTAAGLPRPRRVIETTSVGFALAMLGRGDHLAYLTRSSLPQAPEAGIVPLRLAFPTWQRSTCAVLRRRGTVRPAALAFLRRVAAIAEQPETSGATMD